MLIRIPYQPTNLLTYQLNMIELKEVTKYYGNKLAVDKLTLQIPQGKLFAFIGPNGAGKTTTVKMIAGLLQPTSGEIIIDGKNMRQDSLDIKQMISYIPDQPFLYEKLSGFEFLNFVAQMYKITPDDFNSQVTHYLNLFQMNNYIDQLIEGYSLGMKQKLVIVTALIHNPSVIIVDEPLVGLDPANVKIVKEIFRQQVQKGTIIFMSTHILSIAQEIADIIGVIHQGKLIAQGTFSELQHNSNINLEDIFLSLCKENLATD
ncbi:MAG: ABC transporter ATP-binding protein [Planctomycetota bacterium]